MDFINVPYPHIKITLNNLSYYIEFDPITRWRGVDQLGLRWVKALKKNLEDKLVLEKIIALLVSLTLNEILIFYVMNLIILYFKLIVLIL